MEVGKYLSPLGPIIIGREGDAIVSLKFSDEEAPTTECPWLDLYFSGRQPDFIPEIRPQGTDFQHRVWRYIMTIPFGQTRSYAQVAHALGCRSAQAIGQALTRNPIWLIIPCHRIIRSNGSAGGFAAPGIKPRLLAFENNK